MKKTEFIDIDSYITSQPQYLHEKLHEMRQIIKAAAPNAQELISYKMPAFKFHGILVYFAGFKNHIGFYALPTSHKEFEKELSKYTTGKGSVQFPLDKPLPKMLIKKMVKFRVKENIEKEILKTEKKNTKS